jgi:hypothetical protein
VLVGGCRVVARGGGGGGRPCSYPGRRGALAVSAMAPILETPPPLHPLRCGPSLRYIAPRRVVAAAPCRVDDVAPRVDCCTAARRSGATQELHIRPVTIVPVTCSVFCLKGEKLAPEAPSPFLLPLTNPFLPATRVDALFAWV